jgi:hypothetical protein
VTLCMACITLLTARVALPDQCTITTA